MAEAAGVAGPSDGFGAAEGAGATEGATDGATDGALEGAAEGATDGATDGALFGATEGATDGALFGAAEGAADGAAGGALAFAVGVDCVVTVGVTTVRVGRAFGAPLVGAGIGSSSGAALALRSPGMSGLSSVTASANATMKREKIIITHTLG